MDRKSLEQENSVVAKAAVKKTGKKERGASLVEYALLVALIAVVCIAAVRLIGTSASAKFSQIASEINAG